MTRAYALAQEVICANTQGAYICAMFDLWECLGLDKPPHAVYSYIRAVQRNMAASPKTRYMRA